MIKLSYMDEETKKEFKKVDEKFEKTFEKIDNLADAVQSGFLEVGKRFDKVEGDVAVVKTDLADFKKTVKNQYPDKTYLDNKLGDLAAEIGRRIEKK